MIVSVVIRQSRRHEASSLLYNQIRWPVPIDSAVVRFMAVHPRLEHRTADALYFTQGVWHRSGDVRCRRMRQLLNIPEIAALLQLKYSGTLQVGIQEGSNHIPSGWIPETIKDAMHKPQGRGGHETYRGLDRGHGLDRMLSLDHLFPISIPSDSGYPR